MKIKLLLFTVITLLSYTGNAQRPGWDPATMAEREKKVMLDSIQDLTDDQELVINEIYEQYKNDLEKAFADHGGNRDEMRSSMQAIRKNHQNMIKEILTTEQWETWEGLVKQMRQRRRAGRPQQDR